MAKKRGSAPKSTGGSGTSQDPYYAENKRFAKLQRGNVFTEMGGETSRYAKKSAGDYRPIPSKNVPMKSRISLSGQLAGRTVEFGTRSVLEGMKSFMRGGGGSRLTGR